MKAKTVKMKGLIDLRRRAPVLTDKKGDRKHGDYFRVLLAGHFSYGFCTKEKFKFYPCKLLFCFSL